MPPSGAPFYRQLIEIWSRLSVGQRITLCVFAVVVFSSLGGLAYFMNRVDYEVLMRDLNPDDARAIALKLKEMKKDYIVQGNSILVGGSKVEVDKLRLEIAGSGLAGSGRVGYEIFDKSQYGMTDFTEHVNLQRALEGELSRTISNLSEIDEARVHLTLPKDSPFEEQREPAKASVAVRLKANSVLTKSHIAGIRGLVAGAVSGLRPGNVSIVDEEGKLLSGVPGSAFGESDEVESSLREQLEKEIVIKVISILEPVVGKSKVHANASIELDTNTTEQTEETFNPNSQAILSQQKSEERLGSAGGASGLPGAPPPQPPAAPTPGSERSRQTEFTNYEVSKLTRHTLQPKGTIRRISVAVILDHKSVQRQGQDGKPAAAFEPFSQQELDSYRELVLAVVGFDKDRGDTITLENVPFYREIQTQKETAPTPWFMRWKTPESGPASPWQGVLQPAMKYGSFVLLFLLAYLMLFRPISKRVFRSLELAAPALAGDGSKQLAGIPAAPALSEGGVPVLSGMREGEAIGAADEGGERAQRMEHEAQDLNDIDAQIEREFMKDAKMFDLGSRKFAALKKKLMEKAQKEPEVICQVIRSWMHER